MSRSKRIYIFEEVGNALKRIAELENENAKLKEELKFYKNKKSAGSQKHNEHWLKSYNNFVVQYVDGRSIMEIVDQGAISRRTAYRYKAYYDGLKQMNGIAGEDKKKSNVQARRRKLVSAC